MATFLVTYHGGDGMPATPEARQQVMAAFAAWAQSVGGAMLDPGAPLTAVKRVSPDGVGDGPADGPVCGYTLLSAETIDEATGLVASHPFVTRGGVLQVSQAAELS